MKKNAVLATMGILAFSTQAQISIQPVERLAVPGRPALTYPMQPSATSRPGHWQFRPTIPVNPSAGFMPVPGQNQRYPQYQTRPYPQRPVSGGGANNGSNYGYNNGYSNQRPGFNYGNHGGHGQFYNNRPGTAGWPTTGTSTTTGVTPVIPWWFTGQFNNALPHIRQQRSVPQQPNNGWNRSNGTGYRQPQYNQPYNNYSRPQNGYPYQQRPNYNNGFQRGQQYNQYPRQNYQLRQGVRR